MTMPYLFRPPTRNESHGDPTDMFSFLSRLTYPRGYSVRISGTTVDAYPGVTGLVVDDWDNYDYVYEGGKKHTISDAVYTIMTDADIQWADHMTEL